MVVIPNRVRVVMVVSALALAAGLLTLALLAKPSLATPTQAPSDVTNTVPFSEGFLNQCNGDAIQIDGTITTVDHFTIDANGGMHAQYIVNTHGQGESLTTGVKYVYHNIYRGEANYLPNTTNTYYSSYVTTLRAQGSDTPDWKITISLKYTINSNGEGTAQILNYEFGCK